MLPAIALALALLPPPPSVDTSPQAPPQTQTPPQSEHEMTAPYHVGGGVTPPKILRHVEPQFSKEARKQKVSGVARVSLIVDANGNARNVHIVRSVVDSLDSKHRNPKHLAAAQTLDQAAVDAVEQYKFEPAMLHGKPLPVELNVEVNFQIY
jgi:protein TonB